MNERRRLVRGCALLAVVLVAAGVLAASSATRHTEQAPAVVALTTQPALPAASLPPRRAKASDGGQLRVVEHGFTQTYESVERTLTPGYGPGRPEPYAPVRSGIIVENTSKTEVAFAPAITARYLDQAGRGIVEYGAKSPDTKLTTTAIFPGERAGFPGYLNINLDDGKAARMTAQPIDAMWLPLATAGDHVSRLAATGVTMIRTGSPEVTIFSFTAHSGYERVVAAKAEAIYRDRRGAIVGSSHFDGAELNYPPGDARGSLTVTDWLPTNLDPARTTIYLTVTRRG